MIQNPSLIQFGLGLNSRGIKIFNEPTRTKAIEKDEVGVLGFPGWAKIERRTTTDQKA